MRLFGVPSWIATGALYGQGPMEVADAAALVETWIAGEAVPPPPPPTTPSIPEGSVLTWHSGRVQWEPGGGASAVVSEPVPVVSPADDAYAADWHGDGVTSDLAAWRGALADAIQAGLDDGTCLRVVQIPLGVSYIGGAPIQGGATKGNALVPLRVIPDTDKNFTIVLRGGPDGVQHWHWNQTVRQDSGCVIRTDVQGTNDATFGPLSIIGGPTPQQGFGAHTNDWSNMTVVVDGVLLMNDDNPTICGFDFGGVGRMVFKNGAVVTDAAGVAAHSYPGAAGWQFGLRTPQNNNNARSEVGSYEGVGQNFAAYVNEHTVAQRIMALYCVAGVELGNGGGTGHGISIQHLTVENCDVGLGSDPIDGGFPTKIMVESMNYESIAFAVINDQSGRLLGRVNVSGIGDDNFLADGSSVRGAVNLSIYDMARQPGVQTAPAVPASTVELRNPFFRDALVLVSGSGVSEIEVADAGGAARSVATSASPAVPVLLPTGAYITLTYTSAPTWVWTIL